MLNTRGLYLPGGSPAGQISSVISPSKTLYAVLDPDLGPMTNREAAGKCNSNCVPPEHIKSSTSNNVSQREKAASLPGSP